MGQIPERREPWFDRRARGGNPLRGAFSALPPKEAGGMEDRSTAEPADTRRKGKGVSARKAFFAAGSLATITIVPAILACQPADDNTSADSGSVGESAGSFENSSNSQEMGRIVTDGEVFDQSRKEFRIDSRNAVLMSSSDWLKGAPPLVDGRYLNIAVVANLTKAGEIEPVKVKRAKNTGTGGERRVMTDKGDIEEIFVDDKAFFAGYEKGTKFGIIFPKIYNAEVYYGSLGRENPDRVLPDGGEITIKGSDSSGKDVSIQIIIVVPTQLQMDLPRYMDYVGLIGEKEITWQDGRKTKGKEYGVIREIPKVEEFTGGILFKILNSKPANNQPRFEGGQIMVTTSVFDAVHGRFEDGEHSGDPMVGGAAEPKLAETSDTNPKFILIDPSTID